MNRSVGKATGLILGALLMMFIFGFVAKLFFTNEPNWDSVIYGMDLLLRYIVNHIIQMEQIKNDSL